MRTSVSGRTYESQTGLVEEGVKKSEYYEHVASYISLEILHTPFAVALLAEPSNG